MEGMILTNVNEVALEILESEHIGVMVTNQENRPIAKYMTFQNDGYDLYTLIQQDTFAKMNTMYPFTHILLGYEKGSTFETFVEYEGQFSVSDNQEIAKKLKEIYPQATDDDYTLLHITPNRLRIMNKAGENQEEIIFNEKF